MKSLRCFLTLLLLLTLCSTALAEVPVTISLVPGADASESADAAAEPADAVPADTAVGADVSSGTMPDASGSAQADAGFSFAQDEDARRGIEWWLSKEEVALAEGVKAGKKNVVVKKDVTLYRNDISRLTYGFEEDRLVSRTFQLKSRKNYDTTVYSLFIRYGVPFQMKGRNAVWELQDMQISAHYGSPSTITFTAKELQKK